MPNPLAMAIIQIVVGAVVIASILIDIWVVGLLRLSLSNAQSGAQRQQFRKELAFVANICAGLFVLLFVIGSVAGYSNNLESPTGQALLAMACIVSIADAGWQYWIYVSALKSASLPRWTLLLLIHVGLLFIQKLAGAIFILRIWQNIKYILY